MSTKWSITLGFFLAMGLMTPTASSADAQGRATTDIVGRWQLTMPVGFTKAVELSRDDAGGYVFDFNQNIVLRGVFSFKGNRLRVASGGDAKLDWQLSEEGNQFTLRQASNQAYVGATLVRLNANGLPTRPAEKPTVPSDPLPITKPVAKPSTPSPPADSRPQPSPDEVMIAENTLNHKGEVLPLVSAFAYRDDDEVIVVLYPFKIPESQRPKSYASAMHTCDINRKKMPAIWRSRIPHVDLSFRLKSKNKYTVDNIKDVHFLAYGLTPGTSLNKTLEVEDFQLSMSKTRISFAISKRFTSGNVFYYGYNMNFNIRIHEDE